MWLFCGELRIAFHFLKHNANLSLLEYVCVFLCVGVRVCGRYRFEFMQTMKYQNCHVKSVHAVH